ncbi:MAG: ligase-associated DNA damage response DEXH box helicase [Phycisphaerales bacterium]|nr:ligase-associated DNA damage response DEXH box helicase [Phycisphaerales bacterium]
MGNPTHESSKAQGEGRLAAPIEAWFGARGVEPFAYQRRVWAAYAEGRSGLVHAPTGMGKTFGAWLGPVSEWMANNGGRDAHPAVPLQVLWLTPLRALSADLVRAMREPIEELGLPWSIEARTGDTTQSVRARQRERLPSALVTTPESLCVLLSQKDARKQLATVQCVVVDEWHELMSTKRGTQVELALARLRAWNPALRTWGLSATLGNLQEAMETLVGVPKEGALEAVLIAGDTKKKTRIETLVPSELERFPWSGHTGRRLVDRVIEAIDGAESTLLFCNTRSQVEIWFELLMSARPDWLGKVALHHGSLDRELREKVERGIREGRAKCCVCTSSLDLGVDFSPVDLVLQVGSPKGVARLLQRAGRSGHRPGATSTVIGVPTNAFELVEFAAARDAAEAERIEARCALKKPLDVLAQHVVTIALGGGFEAGALLEEVRGATSYAGLTEQEWTWVLDFVTRGGSALEAYPQFQRVDVDEDGRYVVKSQKIARLHRMAIGTINSDMQMSVRWAPGKGRGGEALGFVEESFIARIAPGMTFRLSGRLLKLERVRDMVAYVSKATKSRGIVPRWGGGTSPLSTMLAHAVRARVEAAQRGVYDGPEMEAVRPILELQKEWSTLPGPGDLLIELTKSSMGHHAFLFPFEARAVHEGLGAVMALRLTRMQECSVNVTSNDYGFELLANVELPSDADTWRALLSADGLLEDMLGCLNTDQLARRRFRDIARVAGLIHPGYPGKGGRRARELNASSQLFFEVLSEFDPGNLLLDQARREVLSEQLEVTRLQAALEEIGRQRMVIMRCAQPTPMAFPLFAESLRTQSLSSEGWSTRVQRMVVELEAAAGSGFTTEAPRTQR